MQHPNLPNKEKYLKIRHGIKIDSIWQIIKKHIIGALHFMPLLGYPEFSSMDTVLDNALTDLDALEKGGIDAIIIENNYDLPHKITVGHETVAAMTYLGSELKKHTRLPLGVSVLWNDYRAALSIAKVLGAEFVRVPVFVDSVSTDFGIISAEPENVINYRKSIGAESVKIFADIQVKHAIMLNQRPIGESAEEAEQKGADAIIVTGKWTGNAPEIGKLKEAKESVSIPVLIGSGLDQKNSLGLLKHADGAIVSTSLKEGLEVLSERNVKPYSYRISSKKVSELMAIIKKAYS